MKNLFLVIFSLGSFIQQGASSDTTEKAEIHNNANHGHKAGQEGHATGLIESTSAPITSDNPILTYVDEIDENITNAGNNMLPSFNITIMQDNNNTTFNAFCAGKLSIAENIVCDFEEENQCNNTKTHTIPNEDFSSVKFECLTYVNMTHVSNFKVEFSSKNANEFAKQHGTFSLSLTGYSLDYHGIPKHTISKDRLYVVSMSDQRNFSSSYPVGQQQLNLYLNGTLCGDVKFETTVDWDPKESNDTDNDTGLIAGIGFGVDEVSVSNLTVMLGCKATRQRYTPSIDLLPHMSGFQLMSEKKTDGSRASLRLQREQLNGFGMSCSISKMQQKLKVQFHDDAAINEVLKSFRIEVDLIERIVKVHSSIDTPKKHRVFFEYVSDNAHGESSLQQENQAAKRISELHDGPIMGLGLVDDHPGYHCYSTQLNNATTGDYKLILEEMKKNVTLISFKIGSHEDKTYTSPIEVEEPIPAA